MLFYKFCLSHRHNHVLKIKLWVSDYSFETGNTQDVSNQYDSCANPGALDKSSISEAYDIVYLVKTHSPGEKLH